MNHEHEKTFRKTGCLYLPGALAKKAVLPMQTHVLSELKRQKIWSGGRILSQKLKNVPVFQQTTKLGQLVTYPGLKEKLITQELYSTICLLAGAPLSGQDAQLLISLPHPVDWTLAGLNWHRDISKHRFSSLPGVQAFVLLDDVSAKGGATLALAGSHRAENQAQARRAISMLTDNDVGRSMAVDNTEFSVVEMAGKAGDVYLMDMRLLHTPSINSTRNVRLMATDRYFLG